MINRNTLQCLSCDAKIITRTQIGHKDVQSHSFPCPNCRVHISFTLDLDRKNGRIRYRDPKNAKWVDSEEGAIETLMFSDELPVPTPGAGAFSPFMATIWNFEDLDKYRHDEALRQEFVTSAFAYMERCSVHFERGDWDTFDKQSPPDDPSEATPRARLMTLYNALQAGFSKFTFNTRAQHNRITQRIKFAASKSPELVDALAAKYLSTGRLVRLWKDVGAVRRLFIDNYNSLQPLIQMAYWRPELRDLSAFAMGVKSFNLLRQLYIDTFETVFRLLVIAVGIEEIIAHDTLEVPMKKRAVSLEEFETFANANKREVIARYPIEDLFVPVLDVDLRNGIGHQAAHYDAEKDTVVLYDTKKSGEVVRSIDYTAFCDQVVKLFAAFELAAMYHHSLHLHVDGRLA